jgi:catechol 2,3-dioxygenase-like lactoylglutathione lyase family enzyme
MEKRERHRGRLIDHIGLVVRDLSASKTFYCAVFSVLNIPMGGSGDHDFWADELFFSARDSDEVQGPLTGRHHIAFQAQDRAMVDAFYLAALAHGGRDNGAPGERAYHPGYYAAFVLDPDGNNIEAVFHGEADRSAASVHITYRIAAAPAPAAPESDRAANQGLTDAGGIEPPIGLRRADP